MPKDDVPMVWAKDSTHQGSMEHCAACGKKIKGEPRHWIEVVDHGDAVAWPGREVPLEESFGSFPVGPDCAKRHFPGYTSAVKW